MPHKEAELDALDDLLMGLDSDAGMLLSEFDGFCAGLIVCPEVISPSEWLPLVLGGFDAFDSPAEVEAAAGPVMAHYNRVAQSLVPPAEGYEAVFDTDTRNDETLWELWMSGFSTAFALRPHSLDAAVEATDPEIGQAVATYMQLHMVAEGEPGLDAAMVAYLTETAPALIPDMVVALNAWTKRQSAPGFPAMPPAPARRPAGKVGRNDPCGCGSGRKYKRCCGAN